MKVETLILKNLLLTEEYPRKVLPFIKQEYFEDKTDQVIFDVTNKYFVKYSAVPTVEALTIEVSKITSLSDDQFKQITQTLESFDKETTELDWLVDTTEKWCQDRAIYLALMESIKIADGSDQKKDAGAIPSILSDALAVSFDNHIGHDYIDDYEERYDSYHRVETKVPFDLDFFNKITD